MHIESLEIRKSRSNINKKYVRRYRCLLAHPHPTVNHQTADEVKRR